MITVRRSDARGHANHGWLDSRHTFSFADYYDPREMGFGSLRVINEDRVQPGKGFGTHPHRDMEIISYVLEGALEHKDSLGTGSVIRPGDVQRMSAGTGVLHSEYNPSPREPVHFLQIWIEPSVRGVKPSYEQKAFSADDKRGRLRLVASPDGADGSVSIHQDARVYAALLDGDEALTYAVPEGHRAYVHVARGSVQVNGQQLDAGDGAKIAAEAQLRFANGRHAELLLFDLA
ncbi:MAG TPA: pirin family protein [Burkholderiales bacterium]|nr:pirin family protein [Burkholderiales bacterium]